MENKNTNEKLQLIPKAELYIEYMNNVILKLPRTEKFSIGNEYKQSIYNMMSNILYVSKIERNKKNIWKLIAIFSVAAVMVFSVDFFFYKVLKQHQRTRINIILGVEKDIYGVGYNLYQSKIAIGSGGFFGKGYMQGTMTKYNFVPEQHTDFIFCTIGEEFGFVGSFVLLSLYLFFLIRIIWLAERQRSAFSRIYGYAIASIIFFHLFVNIGMTIGLMPVIGIPLPFLSYGGSSLLMFSLMFFVFLKQDANRMNIL